MIFLRTQHIDNALTEELRDFFQLSQNLRQLKWKGEGADGGAGGEVAGVRSF